MGMSTCGLCSGRGRHVFCRALAETWREPLIHAGEIFIKLPVEGACKYHRECRAPHREESYELKADCQVIIDLHTIYLYSLGCKRGRSWHSVLFNLQQFASGKMCNYRSFALSCLGVKIDVVHKSFAYFILILAMMWFNFLWSTAEMMYRPVKLLKIILFIF